MMSLNNFISDCIKGFDVISEDRKELLSELVKYIHDRLSDPEINLTFICTHNSRRSHLSQVWAQVAANYFELSYVSTYSGGTEATAVYPSVLNALTLQGISTDTREALFSKRFDDEYNPQSNFAAVMVCNDADQNCPFIPDATRISLPYKDPKVFDGTDIQEEKYLERSKQIATELLYVFSKINK